MVKLRLRTSLFLSLLLLCSLALFAQGRKLNVTADPDATAPAQMGDHDADAGGDHPLEREQWFRSGRTVLGGPAAEQLLRAFHQKQAMQQAEQGAAQISGTDATGTQSGSANLQTGSSPNLTTTGGAWKSIGPSPLTSDANAGGAFTGSQDYGFVSGRMTSVAVDQSNPNNVYIGAAFGGLWKTTNATAAAGSVVWTQLLDAQPTLAVGSVAVGSVNGQSVVLVGTGEGNSSGDSYYGMGILRSTDGGSTWSLVKGADCTDPTTSTGCTTSFVGMAATAIAFGKNGVVVASFAGSGEGSRRNSELSTSRRGLYYSTDAGQSWHRAQVPDLVNGIAITNQSFSATAVVWNPKAGPPDSITGVRPGAFFAIIRSEGYYTSTDGQNWSRLANGSQPGPTNIAAGCNTSNSCQIYRGQIAVQPATGDMYTIYVSQSSGTDGGVYKTDVSAAIWTALGGTGVEDQAAGAPTGTIGQGAYNLWIGAVPVTGGTEVLVGAVDIYKCKLTNGATTCDGNTNGGWLNLTHAYDCSPAGAPAHVHPDQHAFDFNTNTATATQMYFVNDGGVYRSVNGANGDGTCTSANPFDDLNQTMGSVSEFVSISQHPTNASLILGGLQDNGSPALGASGVTPPLWRSVNGGDGGNNAIDPNDPDHTWYTSNFGVSIQQCTQRASVLLAGGVRGPLAGGIACTGDQYGAFDSVQGFATTNNIGPGQVSSDAAEFYPPFILDPANTQNVILGTCRIWRGPGIGGNTWTVSNNISPMFDGNGPQATGTCASNKTSITAIAAGGVPVASQGGNVTGNVSPVIYVGLEGSFSTRSGSLPGHIFVTKNAQAANPGWTDVTVSGGTTNINPQLANGLGPFPISSITIDKSDATGGTAYVTIQGFNGGTGGHVFKTTNFGTNWTDISAGLPDAPANSLAIDPDNASTIYVGTDIGAFVSSNGGSTWQNLGTALPNVPVTTLLVYKNGTDKRLRAATYGRGVWELASIGNNPPGGNLEFAGNDFNGTATIAQNSNVRSSGWAVDQEDGAPVTQVDMRIDGVSIGPATIGIGRPDVASFFNRSDWTNSGFIIIKNIGTMTPGTHTMTAVAKDSQGATTTIGSINFNVIAGNNNPPAGNLEFAGNPSTGSSTVKQSTTIRVAGWSADNEDSAPVGGRVEVRIDGNLIGNATLGGSRSDVSSYFNHPSWLNCGFSLDFAIGNLSVGSHTVSATSFDSGGLSTNLGALAINVISNPNTPPAGNLEFAGNDLNGTANIAQNSMVRSSGWAVDQEDNAPVGGRVEMRIDGNVIGNATIGIARPDVASFFNKNVWTNSGFIIRYNIGNMTPGTHTMTAVAFDSGGVSTQLGAIQFNVVAGNNNPPAGNMEFAGNAANGTTTVPRGGTLRASGWAADNEDTAPVGGRVEVKVDGNVIGNATLGLARSDVSDYFNRPSWLNCGWRLDLPNVSFSVGQHTVTATAFDSGGASYSLGALTINVQ